MRLADFHHELATDRNELRVAEGGFVFSATPAFGTDWKRNRFLPRIGTSLDLLWKDPASHDPTVVGRMVAGFDSSFAAGPVFFRPSFRWRPRLSEGFADDFMLEPRLEVYVKTAWSGVHNRDALRIGVELGYTHASEPDDAFGAERIVGADHSLFARFVLAPTIFTFGAP